MFAVLEADDGDLLEVARWMKENNLKHQVFDRLLARREDEPSSCHVLIDDDINKAVLFKLRWC